MSAENVVGYVIKALVHILGRKKSIEVTQQSTFLDAGVQTPHWLVS